MQAQAPRRLPFKGVNCCLLTLLHRLQLPACSCAHLASPSMLLPAAVAGLAAWQGSSVHGKQNWGQGSPNGASGAAAGGLLAPYALGVAYGPAHSLPAPSLPNALLVLAARSCLLQVQQASLESRAGLTDWCEWGSCQLAASSMHDKSLWFAQPAAWPAAQPMPCTRQP